MMRCYAGEGGKIMEAILQENPDTLIFAGNVGNSGNSEAISSSSTSPLL